LVKFQQSKRFLIKKKQNTNNPLQTWRCSKKITGSVTDAAQNLGIHPNMPQR